MERKPNFIVRCIYAVADFFLDFKPIVDAVLRFMGTSSLILVNLLILCCILILSASHTLEFMRYAGARNGLEWVAFIIFEAAFIACSLVLSRDFKQGNWKSGFFPWAGFWIGFGVVTVSNIMGMAQNWIGHTIGFLTPCMLLISKGLLAHQFKQNKKLSNTHNTFKQEVIDVGESNTDQPATKQTPIKQFIKQLRQPIKHRTKTEQKEQSNRNQSFKQGKKDESFEDMHEQSIINQSFKQRRINPLLFDHVNDVLYEIKDGMLEQVKQSHTKQPSNTHNTFKQAVIDSEESNKQRAIKQESPREIAERLKREEGKYPSIRRLAKEANITTYRSMKVLDELKEQTG